MPDLESMTDAQVLKEAQAQVKRVREESAGGNVLYLQLSRSRTYRLLEALVSRNTKAKGE